MLVDFELAGQGGVGGAQREVKRLIKLTGQAAQALAETGRPVSQPLTCSAVRDGVGRRWLAK
jgi:hypothetical protein